jgi:hypothetical protein
VPAWLVDGPVADVAPGSGPAPAWSGAARRPGLLAVLLAGAGPGIFATMAVLAHRLTAGSPTDDADRINRYLIWLTVGTLVALTVSLVAVAVVPRSGAALGLVAGVTAATVAALGITATNTFLFGNIFDPAFWWSTIVSITALWMVGYLFILPLTLAVWPAPWRDVPGWAFAAAVGGAGAFMALVAALVLVV